MALNPGTFWTFSSSTEDRMREILQRLEQNLTDPLNTDNFAKQWYKLASKEFITSGNTYEPTVIDEDKVRAKIDDIMNDIVNDNIPMYFKLRGENEKTQIAVLSEINSRLKKEQVVNLFRSMQSWEGCPTTDLVFSLILSQWITSDPSLLPQLEVLSCIHSKNVENILRLVFSKEFDVSDAFTSIYALLDYESRWSFIRSIMTSRLSESQLVILQRIVSFVPEAAKLPLCRGLHLSSEGQEDSLIFSRLLLQLVKQFKSNMTSEIRQELLKLCANNRTLLKRQIQRELNQT